MRKNTPLRSEARLQFNRVRNAAVVRVGPAGFDDDAHEAWYASGTIFFELHKRVHGPGLTETISVAEVYGFKVNEEVKKRLIPESNGKMDVYDWRAMGFGIAPHAMFAWFEKERTISDTATAEYFDLARYKDAQS